MLDRLIALDQAWFLRVNGYHGQWGDILMDILSWKHSWVLYLPFFYLLYRKNGWKYSAAAFFGVIVTFASSDLLAARFFKPFFQRLRPCHEPSLQSLVHLVKGCGGEFGFVSNHAANHFGLAVFFGLSLSAIYPRIFRWFLLFAFMVSYSRVYLGVHYPGDVLCGGVLGSLLGFVFYKLWQVHVYPRLAA